MTSVTELLRLDRQVAIVTGGAMGIGEAIVRRLAEAGAAVVIADVDEARARALAQGVGRSGGKAEAIRTDVAEAGQVRQLVRTVVTSFGRLDVVVNNAGIFPFSPAFDTPPELWARVLAVNLNGTFFLSQAAGKQMAAAGNGGRIVNIASVDSLHPTGNLAHYDASKGAVAMLTKSLALEFAPHRIRVNAIAPGGINTPGVQTTGASILAATRMAPEEFMKGFLSRIPLGRMGEPDDIARAALFLSSEASEYMTGSMMVVDGGYLLS